MKRSLIMAAIGAALAIGSVGAARAATGATSGEPSDFSGQVSITGGNLVADETGSPKPKTIQVKDINGTTETVANVVVLDNLTAGESVTVVKAGSNLFTGNYTSTTAQYANFSGTIISSVSLTPAHALANNVLIPCDGRSGIVLPVDSIGQYSFPNGIKAIFNTQFQLGNPDVTLTATGICHFGKPIAGGGSNSYTIGKASTTTTLSGPNANNQQFGYLQIDFDSGLPVTTGQISVPGTDHKQGIISTCRGTAQGHTTSFPDASVTWSFIGSS